MIAATLISLLLPFAQSASPPSHSMLMADDPIPVMVLGTFHFHQTETPDIRTPANQKALHAIVATLSEFSPTMIGLECTSDLEDDINAAYAAWQAGDGEMTRNERQQLGFRLAEANGLDQLVCVDTPFPPAPNFDVYDGWDAFLAYAGERGDHKRYEAWLPLIEDYSKQRRAFMADAPLEQIMDFMNGRDAHYSLGRMLIVEMDVGVGDTWAGPDFYGRFEGRNGRIFASTKLVAAPGDRVLLIMGNAHKIPLDRLFSDSFEFESVPVPRFSADADQ